MLRWRDLMRYRTRSMPDGCSTRMQKNQAMIHEITHTNNPSSPKPNFCISIVTGRETGTDGFAGRVRSPYLCGDEAATEVPRSQAP